MSLFTKMTCDYVCIMLFEEWRETERQRSSDALEEMKRTIETNNVFSAQFIVSMFADSYDQNAILQLKKNGLHAYADALFERTYHLYRPSSYFI